MSGKILSKTIQARKFYKQTFAMEYAGIGYVLLHTLLVNPEEMSVDEPTRASVTQTFGGAFVTDFGAGLPTVTLTGTTGYKARNSPDGYLTDGYHEFKRFRDKIYRGFIETNDAKLALYWFDWENDEFYQIQPMNFRLMRNKSEPLLYRYEFRFTCLQRLRNHKKVAADYIIDARSNQVWSGLGTNISKLGEHLNSLT
jgi:hypothetical protein